METNESSLHPIEILLVEDNPGDSRLAKEALKESKLKNNLYIAEDGVEAMNFLYKTGKYSKMPRPDLVILDLNLPKKMAVRYLPKLKMMITLNGSRGYSDHIKSGRGHP